jgi:anaerobic ribonucleoside-triphosphate reductase activating protein
MSRLAGINKNDVANGEGVCVSVFLQGCPHHCLGCHNPETWDFNGGRAIEDEQKLIEEILNAIDANGIQRNLSLLGGEPLCDENNNIEFSFHLLKAAKERYPDIKTYVWTGSTLEQLQKEYKKELFDYIDVLIDGEFILAERDITLKLRGSKNQRVLYKNVDF